MSEALALFTYNNQRYYMNKNIFTIGRGPTWKGIDLPILDSNFVSRRHLSFVLVDEYFVIRCMSKNGVFVDGVLLVENLNTHKIPNRCSLRFPSTEIVVHFESLLPPYHAQSLSALVPPLFATPERPDSGLPQKRKADPPDCKPPYSYAQLIAQAIGTSSEKRATLSEIYNYISTNYPYFSPGDRSWQNSIRHNLSLSPNFVRASRSPNALGKGSYWCFEASASSFLMTSAFMKRRSAGRKTMRKSVADSAPASPQASKFIKMSHVQSAPASPALRMLYDEDGRGNSN